MKANQQIPVRNLNENIGFILLMFILVLVSFFREAVAQAPVQFDNNPSFPERHKFNVGLITTYRGTTTPAPVLIGEMNYGISNRFSVGVVGGTIGTLALFGGKMAAQLYQHENFRLLYRMTIIYYPERNGSFLFDQSNKQVMPWMLSMGLVDAEWRMKNGVRWSVGMGGLETHCVDGMMNLLRGTKPSPEEEEDELPFDVFNTLQTNVAIPLSRKLTLRPEAIFVFKGTQLITAGEHKVAPLTIYLNLVYTF